MSAGDGDVRLSLVKGTVHSWEIFVCSPQWKFIAVYYHFVLCCLLIKDPESGKNCKAATNG